VATQEDKASDLPLIPGDEFNPSLFSRMENVVAICCELLKVPRMFYGGQLAGGLPKRFDYEPATSIPKTDWKSATEIAYVTNSICDFSQNFMTLTGQLWKCGAKKHDSAGGMAAEGSFSEDGSTYYFVSDQTFHNNVTKRY